MTDQNLAFLKKFIGLYQELIAHDGYSDMEIRIRLVDGRRKEVRLICGREYRYALDTPPGKERLKRYRVVKVGHNGDGYSGPERRSGKDRRDHKNQRRSRYVPRNFKLERRITSDRRSGIKRRQDD